MSWSLEFSGDRQEVSDAFDKQKASSAAYGMIEAEQNDIEIAKYLGCSFAEKYGRVHVSASGHWNATSGVAPSEGNPGGTISSFARASITITPAPTPIE